MNIKRLLDSYYRKYNNHLSSGDPIWNLKFAKTDLDKEFLAFFISCYAYGNIVQINKHVKKFIDLSEGNIYSFIKEFNHKKFLNSVTQASLLENNYQKESLKDATQASLLENNYQKESLKDATQASLLEKKSQKESYYYRFNTEQDFIDLISSLQVIIKDYGSLKSLFLNHYNNSDSNILPALNNFTSVIRNNYKHSKSFNYLLPDVSKNSTCKRLNLFLRWMVRKDSIDSGLWSREVDKAKLIIPVDTHVYRVSRKLCLVERKSCDIKFAIELTEKLKTFDPNDPVKYDFALCHIGVDKLY